MLSNKDLTLIIYMHEKLKLVAMFENKCKKCDLGKNCNSGQHNCKRIFKLETEWAS